MDLKIFPWQRGEKPYFINEDGFEWYILKDETKWCTNDRPNNLPKINAVVFGVVKDGKSIERVLMDVKTNKVLFTTPKLEDMAVHIDILRLSKDK